MKTQKTVEQQTSKRTFFLMIIFIIVVIASALAGYMIASQRQQISSVPVEELDNHTAFVLEVYDVIKKEYWQQVTDQQLALLFRDSAQIMIGGIGLQSEDRAGVQDLVVQALATVKPEQKELFVTQLVDTTLKNLQPVGRSSLYSTEDAQKLANTVNNVDPEVDLLETLGVNESSTSADIDAAYTQKKEALEKTELGDAVKQEQQLLLDRAKQALQDEQTRQNYATSGVEPTFSYNLISSDVVYLHLKQFSPTTPQDMQRVLQQINASAQPTSLIIDLRSNTGGAIDTLPFLLSPFIGANQHAYDFFKQGKMTQFTTSSLEIAELQQYAQIVVLIDAQTQSSAELMASVLKKYNSALIIGGKSKGWGTVERVFPIEKQLNENVQYSVFLVHSLTIREDGKPIEGNGVIPDLEITDPSWEQKVMKQFRNQELVDAVKQLTNN